MDLCHVVFFEEKHLPDALLLLKEHPDVFSEKEFALFEKDLKEYISHIPHATSEKRIYSLLVDNHLAGILMIKKAADSPDYYHIEWLAIKKSQQNKGYGTKLVQSVFSFVKELRGRHIYVETSNEKHNDKVKHFYQNLGFKRVGVLPNFYFPPLRKKRLEDSVIYYKEL